MDQNTSQERSGIGRFGSSGGGCPDPPGDIGGGPPPGSQSGTEGGIARRKNQAKGKPQSQSLPKQLDFGQEERAKKKRKICSVFLWMKYSTVQSHYSHRQKKKRGTVNTNLTDPADTHDDEVTLVDANNSNYLTKGSQNKTPFSTPPKTNDDIVPMQGWKNCFNLGDGKARDLFLDLAIQNYNDWLGNSDIHGRVIKLPPDDPSPSTGEMIPYVEEHGESKIYLPLPNVCCDRYVVINGDKEQKYRTMLVPDRAYMEDNFGRFFPKGTEFGTCILVSHNIINWSDINPERIVIEPPTVTLRVINLQDVWSIKRTTEGFKWPRDDKGNYIGVPVGPKERCFYPGYCGWCMYASLMDLPCPNPTCKSFVSKPRTVLCTICGAGGFGHLRCCEGTPFGQQIRTNFSWVVSFPTIRYLPETYMGKVMKYKIKMRRANDET